MEQLNRLQKSAKMREIVKQAGPAASLAVCRENCEDANLDLSPAQYYRVRSELGWSKANGEAKAEAAPVRLPVVRKPKAVPPPAAVPAAAAPARVRVLLVEGELSQALIGELLAALRPKAQEEGR